METFIAISMQHVHWLLGGHAKHNGSDDCAVMECLHSPLTMHRVWNSTYTCLSPRASPVGIASIIAGKLLEIDDLSAVIAQLGMFMVVVLVGLFIHGCITLPVIFLIFARRNPFKFLGGILKALMVAFGTSSRYEMHSHIYNRSSTSLFLFNWDILGSVYYMQTVILCANYCFSLCLLCITMLPRFYCICQVLLWATIPPTCTR